MSHIILTDRRVENAHRAELFGRLTGELRNPQPGENHEPIILEQRTLPRFGVSERTRLYVIWSDWQDLDRQARSEMIIDAYQEVKGMDEALKVSIVMGITPDEAKRMGVL